MINHHGYSSTRVTEGGPMPHAHAVWVSPTHRWRYQARGRDFPSVETSVEEDSGAPHSRYILFALLRLEVRGR